MTNWPLVWREIEKSGTILAVKLESRIEALVRKHSDGGVPDGKKGAAIAALVEAAKAMRAVNTNERAHLVEIQQLAAEARRTGENLSHRFQPKAFDYGDSFYALLRALEAFEKA